MQRLWQWMVAIVGLMLALSAHAVKVGLGGVMGDERALIVIDGAPPQVMRVGETRSGVRLLEVRAQSVLVEMEGVRREVRLGGVVGGGAEATEAERGRALLRADGRGHFSAPARVNGVPVTFLLDTGASTLLDTGASTVALPRSVATRAGVRLDTAQRVMIQTANGPTPAHRTLLNSIQLGGITLHMVEAVVLEDGRLPVPLLGMSFLGRIDLRQEGDRLTLLQRY